MDNDKTIEHIRYAYESGQARLERTIKRLWILCLILIFALLGTNAGWLYYESQWEITEKTEIAQDIDTGDGDANVTGIGDIYGTSEAESN